MERTRFKERDENAAGIDLLTNTGQCCCQQVCVGCISEKEVKACVWERGRGQRRAATRWQDGG